MLVQGRFEPDLSPASGHILSQTARRCRATWCYRRLHSTALSIYAIAVDHAAGKATTCRAHSALSRAERGRGEATFAAFSGLSRRVIWVEATDNSAKGGSPWLVRLWFARATSSSALAVSVETSSPHWPRYRMTSFSDTSFQASSPEADHCSGCTRARQGKAVE
jgi:hypothetical protein